MAYYRSSNCGEKDGMARSHAGLPMKYIALLTILIALLSSCGTAPGIGQEGQLVSGASQIAVATNEAAFDVLIKALNAKDNYGAGILVTSGQVFTVPSATRVLVIDGGDSLKTHVRILSGDATGQSGWVPREYVKQ